VQHIPLGGLLEWDAADSSRQSTEALPTRDDPTRRSTHGGNMARTSVP
jgi:hypothetical protein